MKNTLYVGNLSFDAEENELRDAFASYGDIQSVKIIKDRDTGRSRGFAFVSFEDDAQASAALEMNNKEVQGRALRVNIAEERKR